ncbi:MAG: hypothetical protein B6226_02230 [Candidatus Cloacimonetes bacterium 4572_65]|nr:MAG: hypothetical protein B6226_02230 [Candidatus Cloacimonetes bacterium 4572_65]
MNTIDSVIETLNINLDKSFRATVGFDGFIDEICHAVDKRDSNNSFKRLNTIPEFAERIAKASGLSTNIELVPIQSKLGGNGPIMANCLLSLNNSVSYIGALGKDSINHLFKDFAQQCTSFTSFSNPGYTEAIEFLDGKIMLGKVSPMQDVTWENLLKALNIDDLTALIKKSELIGFTNWTLTFGMNSIIKGITEILTKTEHNPFIFFDLTDPTKRSNEDILELLNLIKEINKVSRVTLGLNKNESTLISNILDCNSEDLITRAKQIQTTLGIFCCVIHPIEGACSSFEKRATWIDGPYTPTPKLSTGAGDNFNAGFCFGLLNGLTPHQALYTGVATSGFYVRNAKSPNRLEIIDFLYKMATNSVEE